MDNFQSTAGGANQRVEKLHSVSAYLIVFNLVIAWMIPYMHVNLELEKNLLISTGLLSILLFVLLAYLIFGKTK